ncbi:MAG: inositol 2-dehydrogenase [Ahrensia sp.]|nr:inositol 2-dehydrogenase [Ahrensia sp.]
MSVSVALFGCGRIGQVHAQNLVLMEDARLAAVVDASAAAAQALSDKHGAPVSNADAVMNDAAIDAIIVATPTDTHFDLIQNTAAAGKAIFCEKPVDMSTDNIVRCKRAVEAAGVPFLTAFNRRFDPSFARLKKCIDAGEIGDVEQVIITSRDPAPPPVAYIKSSGGIFRDMMIHDFDMVRFLMGEEPATLFATGSCKVDPEIGAAGDFDTAAVTMRTKSGILCQITNSRRASYGYDQRIEVHGSGGMLRAGNKVRDTVEIAVENGFRSAPAQHFFLERYGEAYMLEMQHFLKCVTSGETPSPTIDDGLRAQALADAASRSASAGLVESIETSAN